MPDPPEVVLFFGSRGWSDFPRIEARIDLLPLKSVVISGMARGADKMAAHAARNRGLHVAEVRPLWTAYGRRGGNLRNEAMVLLRPHRAEAFWDGKSPGTMGTLELLAKADIPVLIHRSGNDDV